MKYFNIPAPDGEQAAILRMVGEALLWPESSTRWPEVFRWCDQHPSNEIARTILKGFAAQGGNVDEALTLGQDWEEVKEPIRLTRAFAANLPGDIEQNTALLVDARKRATMRRRAAHSREAGFV